MAKEGTSGQTWTGRTDSIIAPQLAAEFWTEGREISGKIDGWREVTFTDRQNGAKRTGQAFRISLSSPIDINGEETSLVEIPPLTGITAALKDLKARGYSQILKGDIWNVSCVGIRKAKQENFSNSPEFEINVIRK